MDNKYFLFTIIIYILSYLYYVSVSHGLGHKAEYLQLRRFIPCAILAVLPVALANVPLTSHMFITSLITGVMWIITYPLFYFLTNRKVSSDFGFHFDIVFGLYVIGWLMSLKVLVINFSLLPQFLLPVIATVEFLICAVPVAQWVYYYLYGSCVSEDGMCMIQDTHYNEIIEFFKSFSIIFNISIFVLAFLLYAFIIYANLQYPAINMELWQTSLTAAVFAFLTVYLWLSEKAVFRRTGFVELWLDVKEYMATTLLYQTNM